MISLAHPFGRLVLIAPPTASAGTLAPIESVPPPLPVASLDVLLARLHADERALFDALPEARRPTWLAGRSALIAALESLGAPRQPIASDGRGAPVIAAGFSGSIAHKPTLAGALAAQFSDAHVGVDVEILVAPRVNIGSRVLTDAERAEGGDPAIAVMARFAIKEAIYKAVDRFVGRYVGFKEAELLDLSMAPSSLIEAPVFVETRAILTMAQGEGPFVVEASWARAGSFAIAAARVRPKKTA